MSADPRQRAGDDLRHVHRMVRGMIARHGDRPTWRTGSGPGGWGVGERLRHLGLVGVQVESGLREALTGPPPPHRRSVEQSLALTWALTTWRLSELETRAWFPSGQSDVLPRPEVLLDLHLEWVVRFLRVVEDEPAGVLHAHPFSHPRYGPMDAFEWARWFRAYARALERG